MSILNPRTTTYEFLGPPGAFLVSVGVPIATYALYFACSESSGGCPPALATVPLHLSDPNWWRSLWDTDATLIYFAWYFFCVLAWAVLPGDRVSGTTLRTGETKQYKINGTILVLFCIFLSLTYAQHSPLTFLHSASPPVLFIATDSNPSPSYTTNGSASSPHLSSCPYSRLLHATLPHSNQASYWLWEEILEIIFMTYVHPIHPSIVYRLNSSS